MGYHTEVNTLVRLPKDFDTNSLSAGQIISVTHDRERIVPMHIALLLIDKDWNFHGYCRVNSLELRDQKIKLEIEVITVFDKDEKELYTRKFFEATKITGEISK